MANVLLDSAIIVDFLRNHPLAIQWKAAQAGTIISGITPVVWMEVIRGAQNRIAQERAVKTLRQFEMIYLTQADLDWAMNQQLAYHLKSGVGINDCLIAAPAYRLQLPLYTQNLKHFAPLLGALAQKPY